MKRLMSAFAVAASLAFGLAAQTAPAAAAGPAAGIRIATPVETAAQPVQKIDHRRGHDRRWDRRSDRRWDRRGPSRHYGPRSGVYFHFGTAPRRYVAPPRRGYGLSRAHVNWCHNRYRSYDARTNTFQPYNGPRRACYSPYS